VETCQAAHTIPATNSLTARVGWALLILATLYICYFSNLGVIGFVGPDEPRYASVARGMVETGDWVTPRLYGKPWFEKPVLYYWGAALSFKFFGVSEASARLPSAVSALLATLAVGWLAKSIYGAETARWTLLFLPTTVAMIGFSHAATPDMPFSAMLTIAMVAASVVLGLNCAASNEPVLYSFRVASGTRWRALVIFGVSLGAAVLAKGPAAIILCGGAIFFWALFTNRWTDASRLLHPAAVAAFCVTSLPWYILCARRNPDFFHVFIIEHNFKRYLTPEFQHIQPFWFYMPVVLIAFVPWTGALLWASVMGGIRFAKCRKLSSQTALLLSWAVFVLLFFSLSQSKLPGYILPAVPALALVLSRCCTTIATENRMSFASTLFAFAIFCLALAGLASGLFLHVAPPGHTINLAVILAMVVIALANLALAAAFGADRRWMCNLCGALAVAPVLIALLIANFLLRGSQVLPLSSKELADELRAQHVPTDHTFIYKGMQRSLRYGLNFYLDREVLDWDENPDAEAYVLSGSINCAKLNKQGFDCVDIPLGHAVGEWFMSKIKPKGSIGDLPGSR
jgi:4-amino-4-deoxy-L-arabinose transferase-like glycosyltransferase